MGAPVIAAAALNTRTGRKILVGALLVVLLGTGFILTPLIAIPFAISGASATAQQPVTDTELPAVSGEWGYPLAGDYSKGRGFGYHPVEGCSYCKSDHRGYDMDQPCGATVFAAGPGRVTVAAAYFDYGNAVVIDHGGGVITIYGHMQWESLRVDVGDEVSAGTPLGAEGSTGRSSGCHLHFEVRDSGVRIDPEPFMANLGLPLK